LATDALDGGDRRGCREEDSMDETLNGSGLRVRAYFGERDQRSGKSLWSALLEFLRKEGAAGATVTRGIAGYGAHSKIHAASIVDLSSDLPLVLEWIDSRERVERLLPAIEGMLQGGLITTDPVTVRQYQPHADRGR
jgi:PII-like signaling protein